MPQVTRSIKISAPIQHVFSVLAGFEEYPEFLPEIRSASIIKKTAGFIEAMFEIEMFARSSYTLKFKLSKPHKITWSLVKGDNMRSNDGSWELTELTGGKTEAIYSAEINFSWLVPKQVASVLIENHLPKMLKNFKKRAESTGHAKK